MNEYRRTMSPTRAISALSLRAVSSVAAQVCRFCGAWLIEPTDEVG
jgi:hypothetical protein